MTHTPVGCGCRQSHHIEECASTNRNNDGMTIDVMSINRGVNRTDRMVGVLDPLSALDHEGRPDKINGLTVSAAIFLDVLKQLGFGACQPFIQDKQHADRLSRIPAQRARTVRPYLSTLPTAP